MTLYDVLKVDPDSSAIEIEAAYRKRGGNPREGLLGKAALSLGLYADVDYAYRILSDHRTRQRYDRSPRDFLEFHPVAIII